MNYVIASNAVAQVKHLSLRIRICSPLDESFMLLGATVHKMSGYPKPRTSDNQKQRREFFARRSANRSLGCGRIKLECLSCDHALLVVLYTNRNRYAFI